MSEAREGCEQQACFGDAPGGKGKAQADTARIRATRVKKFRHLLHG
jgi:hypothetical protein